VQVSAEAKLLLRQLHPFPMLADSQAEGELEGAG
jgi:hypothetical protein